MQAIVYHSCWMCQGEIRVSAKIFFVIVVISDPEPSDGITIQLANSTDAARNADRPCAFLSINTFES
jgi:hypothetical protein